MTDDLTLLIQERDRLDASRRELNVRIKAARRLQTIAKAKAKWRGTGIRAQISANARDRENTAFTMRNAGSSFEEIAKAVGGVSRTRARDLYMRALKRSAAR